MGFKATASSGDFKPVPAGAHIGRCYQLIDLGTQTEETGMYAGNSSHKIWISFELSGEQEDGSPLTITTKDGKELPMMISKEYTLSMGEKANLRKDICAWRGKQFANDDEAVAFDITKLVGAYGLVNVTHKTSGKGKTYANIAGISPLPAALKNAKPAPVNPNVIFNIDEPDMKLFETLPEFLKEKIRKAPEWTAAAMADSPLEEGEEF